MVIFISPKLELGGCQTSLSNGIVRTLAKTDISRKSFVYRETLIKRYRLEFRNLQINKFIIFKSPRFFLKWFEINNIISRVIHYFCLNYRFLGFSGN